MKKKFILPSAAIVAAVCTAFGMLNVKSNYASALELANIEALSDKETTVKNCPGDGKDVCDAVMQGTTLYIFTYIE